MKVKFLRDYHGPETNEFRHLQGAEVSLADEIALDFIARKIVVSIEPSIEVCEVAEPEIDREIEVPEIEAILPEIKVVKPAVKRKPKRK